MTEIGNDISLPENDYLAILDVITKFNECETRQELKNTTQEHLLPLFEAQAGLYGWTHDEFLVTQGGMESVNIPEKDFQVFCQSAPYMTFNKEMVQQGRLVFAHDIDHSMETTLNDFDRFFAAHPQYEREDLQYFKRVRGGLVATDNPKPTTVIAVHRLGNINKPWTLRDIRVMELIRPHLIHTIKTIFLREELARYKSLTEALTQCSIAVALIREGMVVVFQNQVFADLFDVEHGQHLPKELMDLLEKEIARYNPPFKTEDGAIDLPFFKTSKGTFRLTYTLLETIPDEQGQHWLVRMNPVIEPYSEMNLMMQETGLTPREMEICILIKDGIDNQTIANRLFISAHTVKNHVKQIHKKFDVNTRAQMVAFLYQSRTL